MEGRVPTAHQVPDFNKVQFFYLTRYTDFLNDISYVRIERIESSADGRQHVVHVEYCGADQSEQSTHSHMPFALYEIPKLDGDVRFDWVVRVRGKCNTQP